MAGSDVTGGPSTGPTADSALHDGGDRTRGRSGEWARPSGSRRTGATATRHGWDVTSDVTELDALRHFAGEPPGTARSAASPAVRCCPAGTAHTVAVIGVGYVGLPTAATLAHLGHRVTCGDADPGQGGHAATGRGPHRRGPPRGAGPRGPGGGQPPLRRRAPPPPSRARSSSSCACPRPQGDDGSADLSYVEAVAAEIGPHLAPGTVIVNKSTVPVGSTLVVERVLGRTDVQVVSNPEFLREGTAVPTASTPSASWWAPTTRRRRPGWASCSPGPRHPC